LYRIVFTPSAEKEYKRLYKNDNVIFKRVRAAIYEIAKDPFQGKPLRLNLKGKWSYRIGQYRVLYSIEHKTLAVYIIDIGHRREVYK